jgi:hypothetical protein
VGFFVGWREFSRTHILSDNHTTNTTTTKAQSKNKCAVHLLCVYTAVAGAGKGWGNADPTSSEKKNNRFCK